MEHTLSFGLLDSIVLEIEMLYAFPKTVPYLPKLDSVITPFFSVSSETSMFLSFKGR